MYLICTARLWWTQNRVAVDRLVEQPLIDLSVRKHFLFVRQPSVLFVIGVAHQVDRLSGLLLMSELSLEGLKSAEILFS